MPQRKATKKTKSQKEVQWAELQRCCVQYTKVLFIEVDNVTSKQISVIRHQLRKLSAEVFMGKNVSNKHSKTNLYYRLT